MKVPFFPQERRRYLAMRDSSTPSRVDVEESIALSIVAPASNDRATIRPETEVRLRLDRASPAVRGIARRELGADG
jgi:hypothetical protein